MRYFEPKQYYAAGSELTRSTVWKGDSDTVIRGVQKDVYMTIPRGKSEALDAQLIVDEVLTAPIAADEEYGELVVSLDGAEKVRVPLVALEAVEEGGIFKRLWDSIVLFFLNLVS